MDMSLIILTQNGTCNFHVIIMLCLKQQWIANNSHYIAEMMAWQRSSDNSVTESFVQESNRPAKLDQVFTRFHKHDKPNFHQVENSIAVFKIEQSMK